ncbi:site-specific integrase [Methylocaldum sp. GT1TLB]|uniref:site-specific integrase n=1 Tax=Methylocaldum sp. GT1TLB TaxID=3438965 RepID=UPI003DA1414E
MLIIGATREAVIPVSVSKLPPPASKRSFINTHFTGADVFFAWALTLYDALSWEEIRTIWNTDGFHLPYRLAIRLLLATGGQRSGEVTRAAWSEFDLDAGLWLLPAARVKNKRDHLIPLTRLALDILNDLRSIYPESKWLFPGRHNPLSVKPWNESTLPHAVQDFCEETKMLPWTPKDLRRTVKTRMGELGIDKLVRDRIQNHALNDISAKHYDRYDYVAEKRAALEVWCRQLEELTTRGSASHQVVE